MKNNARFSELVTDNRQTSNDNLLARSVEEGII